ncbi:MAG: acyl-CoA dehydrogenase family protein [Deltaproteobacteria bacterium]|nr:acyl-CoA dehydrogenase family protein [Deltaproteobacteria bacterium]
MDFDLSEELLAVRELGREFAEKEIAPTAAADDRDHRFRRDIFEKMGQLGFFGCVVPESCGGSGLGYLAMVLLTEEIARVHSSARVHINTQLAPAVTLARFGTEEQKRRWVPSLVDGSRVGCFAITEPDSGSDVASMSTRAKRTDGGYVLSGTKTWISNAPVADWGLVYATTDREARHRGLSAFMVELDGAGVRRATLDKMGALASPTGTLEFDDVRVPADQRIGAEGQGFAMCMWQLNQTRLSCAAGALGVARAAREAAVAYANQRQQFGQPIGRFQMIQDSLAQMIVEEEAARLLVYRAAHLADRGQPNNLEVSMAKYAAAEAAAHAADGAFKILGAYGYSTEFPVERYLRDAKSYQIVEGSSNIHKLIIAQDALGYRRANRGLD